MKEVLVSTAEAATLLGITVRQFQRLVKQGVIKPHPSSKSTLKQRVFRVSDVSAVLEIRSKGSNPEAAFVEARQAAIEVRLLRKEVERLRTVLGLDMPVLPVDRDALISLLLECEDALHAMPSQDPEALLRWARILHSLTEMHFELVTFYSDQKEPWKPFLNLGRHLLSGYNPEMVRNNIELNNIYMLLASGLKMARQAAYFHVRNLYGKQYAERITPEVKGCPHEDVIAMSFSNLRWETPQSNKHPLH